MINWAEIDQDFLAVAKDYQDRYNGKGAFLQPGETVEDVDQGPACANAYAAFEVSVSYGEPASPDGGVPVRFEIKEGEKTRVATGWLPSCAIVETEDFTENERAIMRAYLKGNALNMLQGHFERHAEEER